jgi:hypothetical protein
MGPEKRASRQRLPNCRLSGSYGLINCLTHVQLATDRVKIVVAAAEQDLPCEIVIETTPRHTKSK